MKKKEKIIFTYKTHKSVDRENTDCGLPVRWFPTYRDRVDRGGYVVKETPSVIELAAHDDKNNLSMVELTTHDDYLVTCECCKSKRNPQWSKFKIIWIFIKPPMKAIDYLIGVDTIQLNFQKYESILEAPIDWQAISRFEKLGNFDIANITKYITNEKSFVEYAESQMMRYVISIEKI